MYKTIPAFLLIFIFSLGLMAQEGNDNQTRLQNGEDLNVMYLNEMSGSLFIHSAGGLGVGFSRGRQLNGFSKKMLEIECSNFKSPKEVKSLDSYLVTGGKGYSFGKLNSVLLFRFGLGYKNMVYRRVEKKNVEVRYILFAGVTTAFAKPVFLYVIDTGINASRVVRKYDPSIYNGGNILGKASFTDGIGQTKLYLAGYFKAGLSFDYAERYDLIKAVEIGVVVDAYPKAIPMMAYADKKNLLFSVYLKMIWGTKWF